MVSLTEERVVLRRLVAGDREGFIEMNSDPSVRKYVPGLLSATQSLDEMTRIEEHWDTHGFGPWALDVQGNFAGILGLISVSPDMPFAPAVELLYRIIPRFWGQGLATEGSVAALEFGFCDLQLDAVVAFAVEANTGSRRVMEKAGMVYGGDFDHPSISEFSPLRRHVLYSLQRANWRERSSPVRILV